MAVMTISEARAALPEVLNRVTEGEEVTITRHGRPVAVMLRPDIVWTQPELTDDARLVLALRERARRHGVTLEEELRSIAEMAGAPLAQPGPIRLTTVRTSGGPPWSREEIYGDDGR
jgi:antitoxin (DNA-binding transcriptional repressor) of toxin-antitoxin stability system